MDPIDDPVPNDSFPLYPEEFIECDEANDTFSRPEDIALLNKLINKNLAYDQAEDLVLLKDRIQMDSHLCSASEKKEFIEYKLPMNIQLGIRSMRFRTPSRIQGLILDEIARSPSTPLKLIAQGRSGTGKTIAYVLAALSKLDRQEKRLQVICVAPTIELSKQIGRVFELVTQFEEDIRIVVACRGEPEYTSQIAQIAVGTVGGIRELLCPIDWNSIKCFIVDEADIMLATENHFEICLEIMNKVNQQCSIMMVSATVNESLIQLAQMCPNCTNLKVFSIEQSNSMKRDTRHFFSQCIDRNHKLEMTLRLFSSVIICKAIIFCKTRASAAYLKNVFEQVGAAEIAVLTGQSDVRERAEVISKFKASECRLLITTNVLARGIDIKGVNLVINYDIPKLWTDQTAVDADTYLHRAGRTARFDKKGIVVTFIETEAEMDMIIQIGRCYDINFRPLDFNAMGRLKDI